MMKLKSLTDCIKLLKICSNFKDTVALKEVFLSFLFLFIFMINIQTKFSFNDFFLMFNDLIKEDKVFGSLCNILIKCLVTWWKLMNINYILHHDHEWIYGIMCIITVLYQLSYVQVGGFEPHISWSSLQFYTNWVVHVDKLIISYFLLKLLHWLVLLIYINLLYWLYT